MAAGHHINQLLADMTRRGEQASSGTGGSFFLTVVCYSN